MMMMMRCEGGICVFMMSWGMGYERKGVCGSEEMRKGNCIYILAFKDNLERGGREGGEEYTHL
jgi:hypothetical protein